MPSSDYWLKFVNIKEDWEVIGDKSASVNLFFKSYKLPIKFEDFFINQSIKNYFISLINLNLKWFLILEYKWDWN